MAIHLLSPEVASQIAAGEVIERPASVVKELVENALDAGARSISISIEGAGQRLIEVADDGSGIPAAELPLAVERHATSKLHSAQDLFQITTLGFRGEALASIGSVAHLTLSSRHAAAEAGTRLRVEGGHVESLEPVGSPPGTLIRVENLFYNVPARLKFLKHPTTERRQIDTLVMRYALAYPGVRFRLRQDGRPALQTSGNGERREVLAALYGADTARQMLEVLSAEDGLEIEGFISPPSLTRSNRREILFFVNGRPVQDAALSTALLKAYHTLLMVGRFPLGVLFLEMPPDQVDVNVHPTKAEVRFSEPDLIFTGVQGAVRRALLAHTPVPGIGANIHWAGDVQRFPSPSPGPTWGIWSRGALAGEAEFSERSGGQGETDPAGQTAIEAAGETRAPLQVPLLRLIGQIASAYLVAEGPDGLYLIDQHAAHERVLFERFMAQRRTSIPSQVLLEPAAVQLSSADSRLLSAQLPVLGRLGFQVEPFGPNTYRVRAVPTLLSGSDPAAALRVLVEDFEEDETPLEAEIEAKIIARVCKRVAVKAGQTLSIEEQRGLLRDLEACHAPRTCPHGRPTMIHLPVDLLERQFGRKGAR